jgi:hypothetical protein
MEVLRTTTEDLSQDSRSVRRDLNPGLPEYEAEVLTTRPRDFYLIMYRSVQRKCNSNDYNDDDDNNNNLYFYYRESRPKHIYCFHLL